MKTWMETKYIKNIYAYIIIYYSTILFYLLVFTSVINSNAMLVVAYMFANANI